MSTPNGNKEFDRLLQDIAKALADGAGVDKPTQAALEWVANQPVLLHDDYVEKISAWSHIDRKQINKALRAVLQQRTIGGSPVKAKDVDPWPQPVNGAELLAEMESFLRRFVVFGQAMKGAYCVIPAYCVSTHAVDALSVLGYIKLQSIFPGEGKSTLLDVAGQMVRRPEPVIDPTPAVLFRLIHEVQPTLLIDEAETLANGFKSAHQDLIAILNAGYTRGATVRRNVQVGDRWELREFEVFGHKIIASIGKLPRTIMDRSILIRMRKRKPNERIEIFNQFHVEKVGLKLRRKAARWAQDNLVKIEQTWFNLDPPSFFEGNDRAFQVWAHLFAIGIVAGSDWYVRLRAAAQSMTPQGGLDDHPKMKALRACKHAFLNSQSKFLTGNEMCDLASEPIGGPTKLAIDLREFGIRPRQIRIDGKPPRRGYLQEWFDELFECYLPDNRIEDEGEVTEIG